MKSRLLTRLIRRGSLMTIAFLALVCLLIWDSSGLSPVSARIPQFVLAVTLILLLLQLGIEFMAKAGRRPHGNDSETGIRRARAVSAAVWISILLLGALLLGVAAGGSLFCLAYMRRHAGESWPLSIALAAGLGLGLWLLFGVFLQASLYPGLLTQYFV